LDDARFAVPSLPVAHVSRRRLLQRLESSSSMPLVLLSAPAGTGKTTLAAEWVRVHGDELRIGWVTLEAAEDRLWPHVVRCLERLGVELPFASSACRAKALGRNLSASLAAALARHPVRLTLVLDGYEFASAEESQDLDFLLRHSNHHLQVVILTRADPLLPLYRYRLEEDLLEVRVADLAFSDAEAVDLLDISGVKLSDRATQALNARTRGWAAGLRFAVRTLAERDDPERAVDNVVAEVGDIGEYLLGEVLDLQPPGLRQLLLDTSLPVTLVPGLLEELGGPTATRDLLLLTRRNAFVEPVAGRPGCYRYYPFFRDLLRAQLTYEDPRRMVELQRRTAAWFAGEGLLAEAVSHLAVVDGWEDASELVVGALAVGRILSEGASGPLSRALQPVPSDLKDPATATVRAALALTVHDLQACDREVGLARVGLEAANHAESTVLSLAVLDAMRARYTDDPVSAGELAAVAWRELTEAERHSGVDAHRKFGALVHACEGIARLRCGSLADARAAFVAGAETTTAPDAASWKAECLGNLGLIHAIGGELAEARRAAGRALALVERADGSVVAGPPAAHVALAWVGLEQYDITVAQEHVSMAMQSDLLASDRVSRSLLEVVKAGLERARDHLPHALVSLELSRSGLGSSNDPWLADRLRVEVARLRLASGQTEHALRELESALERDEADALLAGAQVQLALGREAAAGESLARSRAAPMSLRSQVESLLVEAVHEYRRQSSGRARVALDRSLRLAAREGIRRPFFEAAPTVQRLLSGDPRLTARNRWLTDGVPHPFGQGTGRPSGAVRINGESRRLTTPVESLTAKELEVLALLAQLLSTDEVAESMFVSVNTVRTHIRSILRKLGVSRRNAAVRRARELGLVDV